MVSLLGALMLAHHLFATELGVFAIAWNGNDLCRLVLPEADADSARARLGGAWGRAGEPEGEIAALVSAIMAYAGGEAVDFRRFRVDLGEADRFRRDIYAAARCLGHGEVSTYGELAARAGHAGKARETGAALGRNPVPLVVPCHRVLAAGGRLGGFSAPGGAVTKARLLAHERADTAPALPGQQSFSF